MTREVNPDGSDAQLVGQPWRLVLPLALQAARSMAEEARVLSTEPKDDPGEDYDPPSPTLHEPGGFDPLP
jgi:hypothetical protein